MPALLHPGVYVREIPGGARSIEGVPTSTTIFVGETERGPLEATRISGRTDYARRFGGYKRMVQVDGGGGLETERVLLPYALDGFFANGGTAAYVLRISAAGAFARRQVDSNDFLQAKSPGVWGDGIWVTTVTSSDGNDARFRLVVFYQGPDDANPNPVEEWDRLSTDAADENYVVDVLRRSAFIRWHDGAAAFRPSAFDDSTTPPRRARELLMTVDGSTRIAVQFVDGAGGDERALDVTGLLDARLAGIDDASLLVAASSRMLPHESTSVDAAAFVNFENVFVDYAANRPQLDLFFVGGLPSLVGDDAIADVKSNSTNVHPTTYNAVYWPHVEVSDPVGPGAAAGKNPSIFVPPAGHMAGLYAKTDGRRGVWKAPAGTESPIGGIRSLQVNVLDGDQDQLNPIAVNALRKLPPAGLVVWGARTRQPSSEWRYIPVRRTAIFLRKSIYNGIQWAVFEPNDDRLYQSLRNTIGAFMETQFRNGAFFGATSREAYFVKCDRETTTDDDRTAGVVNILVGFCPLRPAEFVVVSLQQMAGKNR